MIKGSGKKGGRGRKEDILETNLKNLMISEWMEGSEKEDIEGEYLGKNIWKICKDERKEWKKIFKKE